MGTCVDCGSAHVVTTRTDSGRVCDSCLEVHLCDLDRYAFGAPIVGQAMARFSNRLVGVELETGEGATAGAFVRDYLRRCKTWAYKEDGSLNSGGMELVSPPVSGTAIPKEIHRVYRLLGKHGVDMRDDSAGSHIHVDMQDVFENLRRSPTACGHFLEWGNMLVEVVRRLVDEDRADNCYCSDDFGYRYYGEGEDKPFLRVRNHGDCAVAIRRKTLEFRIWSVSDRASLTLARAEFSQRVVDYLNQVVLSDAVEEGFTAWKEACQSLRLQADFTPLARLLGLSRKAVSEFKDISRERSLSLIDSALEDAS